MNLRVVLVVWLSEVVLIVVIEVDVWIHAHGEIKIGRHLGSWNTGKERARVSCRMFLPTIKSKAELRASPPGTRDSVMDNSPRCLLRIKGPCL